MFIIGNMNELLEVVGDLALTHQLGELQLEPAALIHELEQAHRKLI